MHHGRGVHWFNFSDLPLFDLLFGTFRNPKDFVAESGFEGASSAQIVPMLLFRDVAAVGAANARPDSPQAGART